MREICFDTETTGLDPRSGHRVVEIGCVEIIDRVKTENVFHKYINPERDMPTEAFEVHGLSEEFLSKQPIFESIAQEFVDFVGDAPLIAHNASFDMRFVNFELQKVGLKISEKSSVIDTLQIARKKYPGAKNTLDALCKRFEISLESRTKHGALLDAALLADVYLEMVYSGHNLFSGGSGEEESVKGKVIYNQNPIKMREFKVNKSEADSHQAFFDEFIKKQS